MDKWFVFCMSARLSGLGFLFILPRDINDTWTVIAAGIYIAVVMLTEKPIAREIYARQLQCK
jgi:hypothetical protein